MEQNIVTVTEKALLHIRDIYSKEGNVEGKGLRLGVIGGGCSGLSYKIEFSEIKEKLNDFKSITDKVIFINDDFNKIDLSKYISGETLVWISNLLSPIEL